MKLKDLPPPKENGTNVKLFLRCKFNREHIGILYSPYKIRGEWHVPFLPDKEEEISVFNVKKDIAGCEMIE